MRLVQLAIVALFAYVLLRALPDAAAAQLTLGALFSYRGLEALGLLSCDAGASGAGAPAADATEGYRLFQSGFEPELSVAPGGGADSGVRGTGVLGGENCRGCLPRADREGFFGGFPTGRGYQPLPTAHDLRLVSATRPGPAVDGPSPAGARVGVPSAASQGWRAYPGAVDYGTEAAARPDSGGATPTADSGLPPEWYYGHDDRPGNMMPSVTANLTRYSGVDPLTGDPLYAGGAAYPAAAAHVVGNPYNASRTAAPVAAGPCEGDEANDMELDVDESNTYQVRARNDPDRVAAGTMQRLKFLRPKLTEAVEYDENRFWWGRHEY